MMGHTAVTSSDLPLVGARTMARKQLTKALIERTKPPASGRVEILDSVIPQLALRVSSTGAKSFVLRTRVDGKQFRYTIGDAVALDLARARDMARDVLINAKQGIDPRDERRERQREAKVADARQFGRVSELFLERYAKKRTRSWPETQRILAKYVLPRWGSRDVRKIGRSDVVELLDAVEDNHGPIMANRVLAVVRKLFNWCITERGILDANPVVPGMSRADERKRARQRWLREEEIKGLWAACGAMTAPFGPFVKMLLVTGQRRGEMAHMRWQDLDLEARLWTIPRAATKTDVEHEVPLSDLAMTILTGVPRQGTYVFTTLRRGDAPISGFSLAKRAVDERFQAEEPWTLHDLRRTFSTHTARLGVPRLTISQVLNHADGGTTAIYDRHSYLAEKRAALDRWAGYLESIVKGRDEKVVALDQRRTSP